MKSHKTVSAYFTSKQILPFDFAEHYTSRGIPVRLTFCGTREQEPWSLREDPVEETGDQQRQCALEKPRAPHPQRGTTGPMSQGIQSTRVITGLGAGPTLPQHCGNASCLLGSDSMRVTVCHAHPELSPHRFNVVCSLKKIETVTESIPSK